MALDLINTFKYRNLSDSELMMRVKADDRAAFKVIYNRYKGMILSFITYQCKDKVKAEELSQEVFLKVYRFRQQFDMTKKFKNWIYQIARNQVIDSFRKKGESNFTEGEEVESFGDEKAVEFDNSLIAQSEREVLRDSINKLKDSHKEALLMWIDELSYEDMSNIAGKTPQAMKNLVNRAKVKIIELCKQEENLWVHKNS